MIGVFWSAQTSVRLGVFVSEIVHTWLVTVAVTFALFPYTTLFRSVAFAVAMFVVVALMLRVLVSVAEAPGASGPKLPTLMSSPRTPGVALSCASLHAAFKQSSVFFTT